METKKNIAFYHPSFPAGGTARITIDIIRYFKEHPGNDSRYNPLVLCQELDREMMTDEISRIAEIIKLPGRSCPIKEVSDAVRQAITSHGIKIIVQVGAGIYDIRTIARETGCKTVFAYHGEPFWEKRYFLASEAEKARNSFFRKAEWILFRKFKYTVFGKAGRKAVETVRSYYDETDAFTTLCDSYRSDLIKGMGLDPSDNRIYAIENPEYRVDSISFERKRQILFVGRLSHFDKRADRLLEIWGKIQDRLSDWELIIVGDGEERQNLENLSSRLGLERISFEGSRTDTDKYYRQASVLCLTSSTEGWPLCLTEAQAHGVIPVAFDCSAGVREILSPSGKNGFLIKPFDKNAFADILVKIAGMDEKDKTIIRQNVIAKSRTYSIENIGKKWSGLFETLLDN